MATTATSSSPSGMSSGLSELGSGVGVPTLGSEAETDDSIWVGVEIECAGDLEVLTIMAHAPAVFSPRGYIIRDSRKAMMGSNVLRTTLFWKARENSSSSSSASSLPAGEGVGWGTEG